MTAAKPAATLPVVQVWAGFHLTGWLRLLSRNRFAVGPGYRWLALRTTLACSLSSALGLAQKAIYGNKIARTPLTEPPLFVLGHWRSGTTFLHDLLALDPRHIYPTTYECFMPHHFLLSENLVRRRFPVQAHREIDDVEWTWDSPQEGEWALALLGQPSPYLTAAFPNHPPHDAAYLDLEGVGPRRRDAWKRTYHRYLQALTFRKPGRLVLKSPTNLGRIKILQETFPGAKFVHIVRNPYDVIPSTLRAFRLIYSSMGLQKPTFDGLEAMVFSSYERMFRRLEADRHLVPAGRFYEVKYEDLARDPVGEVKAIYERLEIAGFAAWQPRLQAYLADLGEFHNTSHPLGPELRERIARQCQPVIARHGYSSM